MNREKTYGEKFKSFKSFISLLTFMKNVNVGNEFS